MSSPKRPIIAVVTALANGFAEKELLGGIISENMKSGYSTAVISNIYNIVQQDADIICERKIYDLVRSPDISGIILLCESFTEENIRRYIASLLAQTSVPVIGIGSRLEEFSRLDYTIFSTDDAADLEIITSHLIEEHGFTDIAFLTGMEQIETSQLRAEGFCRALRSHGIAPDKDKIYYGDFWLTSGEQLADRYISGELTLPQAVICANDMMAYGMLRRFSEAGINVPGQVTVVSYEYSDRRIFYSPMLTSLRKDRHTLGSAAAKHLQCLLEGRTPPEFTPPRGSFVFGRSCPCRSDEGATLSELSEAEHQRLFTDMSLLSTMEHKLTLCRDMESFIWIVSGHQWMIQNKKNIYLCLYQDWSEASSEPPDIMRSVSISDGSMPFEMDHLDLRTFFERDRDAAVCYLNPLFSGQKLFGYMALLYAAPLSYDDVYRHWLKSVSIGLEFLRLKNDIRYLISCQSVSEYRDTLTGMNNKKGLRRAFHALHIRSGRTLYLTSLRIDLFPRQLNDEEIRRRTEAILSVSKTIGRFCGSNDIAGRISEDTFVCLVQSRAEPDALSDLLTAMILQDSAYTSYAGTCSFSCCTIPCGGEDLDPLLERSTELLRSEHNKLAALRRNKHYAEMQSVRDRIYSSTEVTFEPDSENIFTDRIDSFRRNYKRCFGVSFHQDCINARIVKAKYYLAATSLSINEISEKCGYFDHKYFQRQFAACTGIPALQYRNLMKD